MSADTTQTTIIMIDTYADCQVLSVPANGNIAYTDNQMLGSVATYSCDERRGYVLADTTRSPFNRTCQESGWSLTETTCDCKSLTLTTAAL